MCLVRTKETLAEWIFWDLSNNINMQKKMFTAATGHIYTSEYKENIPDIWHLWKLRFSKNENI